MPNLEDRVTVLETRVNQIEAQVDHSNGLAVVASREALTAREAHQKNIELLNALRRTQAEQGRRLESIDGRLDRIEGSLGMLTAGMHTLQRMLGRLADEGGSDG